ncbi:GNAT family N-acetyltransferase [Haploplasma axanthum]|uniref:Ribosomal-protein-alanine N-acetyltransferase n=1 Tax=Haploplasma axanthum TaxID=29552 RepID=A0A449BEW4_HAPAX|nr:GNAT family N-acetyltransferase [Haploplasma axanthum]VEU80989.1 ribosomal-protein-alanine N-acetyltransferase [Haploplasma axanthum]
MIRKMTENDYEIFLELTKEFYIFPVVENPINDEEIESTFKHIIEDSPYIDGYLIFNKKDVIGFFIIAFGFATEYGGTILFFEDLYIRDKYQGNGIGRKIFKFVEEKYRDEVYAIKLEVGRSNYRAKTLYQKLGYKESKYVTMIKKI